MIGNVIMMVLGGSVIYFIMEVVSSVIELFVEDDDE